MTSLGLIYLQQTPRCETIQRPGKAKNEMERQRGNRRGELEIHRSGQYEMAPSCEESLDPPNVVMARKKKKYLEYQIWIRLGFS